MNILNEEVRVIREQIAFKRQLLVVIKGEERKQQLDEEIALLEDELSARLEKLQ